VSYGWSKRILYATCNKLGGQIPLYIFYAGVGTLTQIYMETLVKNNERE